MAMDPQTSDLLQKTLIGVATGTLGAFAGALINKKFTQEKPIAFVIGIEFSSVLLSRVDYIELDSKMHEKYKNFPWSLTDNEPTEATLKSIGVLQESFYCIEHFLLKVPNSIKIIKQLLVAIESSDQPAITSLIEQAISDTIINRILGYEATKGVLLPKGFNKNEYKTEEPTYFAWSHREENKANKTSAAYSIKLPTSRIVMLYKWDDEKHNSRVVSYAIASKDVTLLPFIFESILEKAQDQQSIASELRIWLSNQLINNSTINIQANISNLGKLPVLINQRCTLVIPRQGKEPIRVECLSENTSTNHNTERGSTNRAIEVYKQIAEAFDTAIPIKSHLPLEKIFIGPDSNTYIAFRSIDPIDKIEESNVLINYYHSKDATAFIEFTYLSKDGIQHMLISSNFPFMSSILKAGILE